MVYISNIMLLFTDHCWPVIRIGESNDKIFLQLVHLVIRDPVDQFGFDTNINSNDSITRFYCSVGFKNNINNNNSIAFVVLV